MKCMMDFHIRYSYRWHSELTFLNGLALDNNLKIQEVGVNDKS